MSGGRPDSDTARRGGLVPFTGSSNGRNNNNNNNNNAATNNSSGYPKVSSNKAGNVGGNTAPENVKTSTKGGNDQLWSNGSGAYTQGSAPVWPENQQGVPTGPAAPANPSNNFDTRQTAGPGPVGGGYIQGPQQQQQQQQQAPNFQSRNVQQGVPVNPGNNPVGGGYIQDPQQQQASSFQSRNVQQGVPVNPSNNPVAGGYIQDPVANGSQQPNRPGSQGGVITQGSQRGSIPKGDYVYYDGKGNQIQPGAPPGATGSGHWTGSGSERHFHHHYYYNQPQQPQQPQQPAPVGYPYDKNLEQKKKRRPGAKTLAAALIACWACTCCCHVPCGC